MIPVRFAASGTESDCLMHCTASDCSDVCYLDLYNRVSAARSTQDVRWAADRPEPAAPTRRVGTAA
ncbi:hypothetical protein ABH930_004042 [Kitasatospora sp. GAS204A]|nr:hypothetical protein [Kitasatospora sp. GAS204B]